MSQGNEGDQASPTPPPAEKEAGGGEDQITNAIAFLKHPKVLESSEASKRSFLESKGLSKEQIDEAFKRVGPSRSDAAAGPATSSEPPSAKPWEKAGPNPANGAAQTTTLAAAPREPLRWTQVVLGAGFAAGGVYVAKKGFERYATRFLHSVMKKNTKKEDEEKEEENAKLDEMVSQLKNQNTELQKSVDSLKTLFLSLEGSVSEYKSAAGNAEDVTELKEELKSLASTINQFASPEKAYEDTLTKELSAIKTILSDINTNTPQSKLDGPTPNHRTMSQLLEESAEGVGSSSKGPAVKEINYDQNLTTQPTYYSPTPNKLPPPAADSSNYPSSSNSKGKAEVRVPQQPQQQHQDDPPRPHSYMEILEMLEKNQTPPGIRTDIDDKVKVPNQSPTESSQEAPPLKPWQQQQLRGGGLEEGEGTYNINNEINNASPSQGGWTPPPVPTSYIKS